MTPNRVICSDALSALKDMPDESVNCSISSPPYWALRDYSACDCNVRRSAKDDSSSLAGGGNVQLGRGNPNPNCPKCKGTGKNMDVAKMQLGLEPTIDLYIDHLCTIYDEVFRVLRKDGSCWVNLGDTYGTQSGRMGTDIKENLYKTGFDAKNFRQPKTTMHKSLCLIPQRFAIEMVNPNWVIREDISEKDRKYVLTELINRGIL